MQKLKNNLWVLGFGVCLILTLFFIPVVTYQDNSVSAETGTPDANGILYYTYNSSTLSYKVSDCALTATSVTIPETFDDGVHGVLNVTTMSSAFYECTSLTSVTIPDTITSIGNLGFYNCTSLTSITIPDAVTSIGDWAFCNCTSLATISISTSSLLTSFGDLCFTDTPCSTIYFPDNLSSIGDSCFSGCSNLNNIEVSENNNYFSILNGVLMNKDQTSLVLFPRNLTSFVLPDTVTSINFSAFYECTALQTLTISGNSALTTIGGSAFTDCTNLTSVYLPSGIISIGSRAFYNCSSITSITLPSSLTTLGEYAFYGCISFTDINIPAGITSMLGAFQNCSSLETITFEENSVLTNIGDNTFYKCTNLSSITVPDTVTNISKNAFQECSSLTTVTFSTNSSLSSIGVKAFYKCSNLTSILIPDSVLSIGDNAFDYTSNLTTVTISMNSNLTTIGSETFEYCHMTSINIPSTVTSIGNDAFYGCSQLTAFNVAEDNPNYSSLDGVLFNKDKTTLICFAQMSTQYYTVPDGVIHIDRAFARCENILEVTISDSVESIYFEAFDSCHSLRKLNFSENSSLTLWGGQSLWGCSQLTSITIPAGVTAINSTTFEFCSNVKTVNFVSNNTLTSIGEAAFMNCSNIASISIPDSVVSLGSSAFCNGFSLANVYISPASSLTTLQRNVFNNCPALKSLTLPAGVTSIGDNAFYRCTNFNTLVLMSTTPPTLSTTSAFLSSGITATTGYIYVPEDSVEAYKTATNWSTFADRIFGVYDLYIDVAFNSNGGTGTMAVQEFNYNVAQNLSANIFTRDGYNFVGWSTTTDGAVEYLDTSSFTCTSLEDLTLYAVWEEIPHYIINFYGNNETSGTMTQQIFYLGDTNLISPNAYTRTGYLFTGWSTTTDGAVLYTDSTSVTELVFEGESSSLNLYAIWTVNTETPYLVEYYQQNILDDGYTLFETSNLTGTAFETANAEIKNYIGFNHITNINSLESGEIAGDGTLILAVYYDRQTFTVIFINEGTTYNTQTVKYMGDADTPSAPTKTATAQFNYTFTGWDTTYTSVEENLTVTATYSTAINYYDVIFKDFDDTVLKTQSVAYGSNATPPSNPSRTGYNFDNWDSSYTNIVNNTSIKAVYSAITYTVVFDNNGATSGSMNNQTFTYDIPSKLTNNTFAKTGYTFGGWAWGDETYVDEVSIVNLTETDNDIIDFVAIWIVNTYTITFMANEGTGTMADQTFTYDLQQNLNSNTFILTGYTFTGWNTLENGEGTDYTDNQSIINLTSIDNENIVLYAQWSVNIYTVTFNANGGENINETLTIIYGSEISDLPTPEKTGYVFLGWYLDGVKIEEGTSFTLADDVQLVAEWRQEILYSPLLYIILGLLLVFISFVVIIIWRKNLIIKTQQKNERAIKKYKNSK